MRKKAVPIPVNKFGDHSGSGISIERIAFNDLPALGDWQQPERHDLHSFFLLEKGSVTMEIDFQLYHICSPSVIYMHPDQVHRIIGFENVTVCAWAAENENLNEQYLKLLEDILPAAPISVNQMDFELLLAATSLCIRFSQRRETQLYRSLLKDSCNALVGLVISICQRHNYPTEGISRQEAVSRNFRKAVDARFKTFKRPANYAQELNLSVPYLNECVKNSSGHSLSHHIQQRIILEAKRLLYHSELSLKEIAAALGYDDYPYFSRLFSKVTGISPLAFRNKNRD